jgi:hypothetical protein
VALALALALGCLVAHIGRGAAEALLLRRSSWFKLGFGFGEACEESLLFLWVEEAIGMGEVKCAWGVCLFCGLSVESKNASF